MNNTAKLAAIDAIYAKLPKLDCQRKCTACCCHFGMTSLEKRRIEQRVGPLKTMRVAAYAEAGAVNGGKGALLGVHSVIEGQCPMLIDGACSVYDIRPAICRLWGLTERMKCPHGCLPDRFLTDDEAFTFMSSVQQLGL